MIAALLPVLPLIGFVAAFLGTIGFICRRQGMPFKDFIGLFLERPASVKTWALCFGGPALCLLLSIILAKIGDDSSWPHSDPVAMARIQFYLDIAIGLELLVAIVLGALGAVTFKGQGPGGVSFQLNQDPAGGTSASVAAPAVPAKETAKTE